MSRIGASGAGVVLGIILGALLAVDACSPYPGASVAEGPGGNLLVEIREQQSFRALALFVYGDAGLGPAVAELANLPFSDGIPAGTVLELPPKDRVKEFASQEKKASGHLEEGERALAKGDIDRAVKHYDKALAIRPDRSDILLAIGRAHLRTGNLDGAEDALDRAAVLRPADPETRSLLGMLYRRRGLHRHALTEFESAHSLAGDRWANPRAAYEHALTLEDLGDKERAREAYRLFLFEFPGDPWSDPARDRLEQLDRRVRSGDEAE